jgi:hypothetical protein
MYSYRGFAERHDEVELTCLLLFVNDPPIPSGAESKFVLIDTGLSRESL